MSASARDKKKPARPDSAQRKASKRQHEDAWRNVAYTMRILFAPKESGYEHDIQGPNGRVIKAGTPFRLADLQLRGTRNWARQYGYIPDFSRGAIIDGHGNAWTVDRTRKYLVPAPPAQTPPAAQQQAQQQAQLPPPPPPQPMQYPAVQQAQQDYQPLPAVQQPQQALYMPATVQQPQPFYQPLPAVQQPQQFLYKPPTVQQAQPVQTMPLAVQQPQQQQYESDSATPEASDEVLHGSFEEAMWEKDFDFIAYLGIDDIAAMDPAAMPIPDLGLLSPQGHDEFTEQSAQFSADL